MCIATWNTEFSTENKQSTIIVLPTWAELSTNTSDSLSFSNWSTHNYTVQSPLRDEKDLADPFWKGHGDGKKYEIYFNLYSLTNVLCSPAITKTFVFHRETYALSMHSTLEKLSSLAKRSPLEPLHSLENVCVPRRNFAFVYKTFAVLQEIFAFAHEMHLHFSEKL